KRDETRSCDGDTDLKDDVAAAVHDLQTAPRRCGRVAPGDAADAMLHAGPAGGVGDGRRGARGSGDCIVGAIEYRLFVNVDAVGNAHDCAPQETVRTGDRTLEFTSKR